MTFKWLTFVLIFNLSGVCFSDDILDLVDVDVVDIERLYKTPVQKLTAEQKLSFRRVVVQNFAPLNSLQFDEYCNAFGLSKFANNVEHQKSFELKKDKIKKRNEQYSSGNSTVHYKLGPRSMFEVFQNKPGLIVKNQVKQAKRAKRFVGNLPCKVTIPSNYTLPQNFTWRTLYNFPVKDQGDSGACWATSTASSLEYYSYRYFNSITPLSVQQACDCSPYGDCDTGGFMTDYFDMCLSTGATSESVYPYTGKQSTCKLTNSMTRVIQTTTFRSYCYANTNEDQLAYLLKNYGPFTAAIHSSCEVFQYYGGGVITPKDCNLGDADHAVLVVGYGTDPITGLAYWECKNSWGAKWGEGGYFRMQRGVNCCFMMSCPEALLFPRP